MSISSSTLKKGLLLFWSLFYGLIFLTNLLEGLKSLHFLPPNWHYVSGNFSMVMTAIQMQSFPNLLGPLLFTMDILWQGITGILFVRAFWFKLHCHNQKTLDGIITAFASGIALWATFIIVVEFFIAFSKISESLYWNLMIAHFLSLLVIYKLPEIPGISFISNQEQERYV